MEIEVLQEKLVKGLELVSRAIANRTQLPVLSNCLLEANKEGLILSATDLELGLRIKVAAKVEKEGRITVPAKMLLEFLGTTNPGKVQLKLDGEALQVTAGVYSAKLQTMPVDEFPQLSVPTEESLLGELEAKALGGAVGRVIFASAKDSLRPVLTGVLWEVGREQVKLVATDGFRLATEEVSFRGKKEKTILLVPARVTAELVKIGEGEAIKVGHLPDSSQVYFEVGDIFVVSQLIEGNFPDYQRIVPKEFTSELELEKEELLQAVRAMHIFARDNSNMMKWGVKEGVLELTSSSPEKGECRATVTTKLTGDVVEIVFNTKYVLDYLGVVGGEKLKIGLGGKLAPGMFGDTANKRGEYVIMPINA